MLNTWSTAATSAIGALRRDLDLMMKLKQFRTQNQDIPEAEVEKLQRHLWYHPEENIFDKVVSLSTKRAILSKMEATEACNYQNQHPKRCMQSSDMINDLN